MEPLSLCWQANGPRVKTAVIGEVCSVDGSQTQETQRSQKHSCFSRMADAPTFADLASWEIARRGLDLAHQVAAVQDGAKWLQGFVDAHRPDAVHILDAGSCC
ncbi:MAG TPA: hypothetical protein VKR06_08555 [Ktedonosporobacter sp.]|nr:hypothetical protein [Ktedonosporobacter sp.]